MVGKTDNAFKSGKLIPSAGLIPRVLDELFTRIITDENINDNLYEVRISLIELYLEKYKDLLMRKKVTHVIHTSFILLHSETS